jgi:signal transduction histidine kinase
MAFAIDRTEAVLARRAVDQARAKAEHANHVKDEFLAIVSHELRTPLSSILGWAANARGKKPSADVERALDIIERNALAQARLIDDILDVSRIVAGQLRLETKAADLGSAVENAIESLRPTADGKGVALLAEIGALGIIEADTDRIHQVIWNVVSNAIKFTKAGGHVWVDAARDGERVTLRIVDDGEGLDPAFVPFVFEPFRQGDASTTRRHGGLGLGLAIAHQIVLAHDGSIRASSEGKGRGTTFVIELPAGSRADGVSRARARRRGATRSTCGSTTCTCSSSTTTRTRASCSARSSATGAPSSRACPARARRWPRCGAAARTSSSPTSGCPTSMASL